MKTRNPKEISVQYLKGVGPSRKKLFLQLGVETIEDLLYFFPRRYEDRRQMTTIAQIKLGEWQTVTGKVLAQSASQAWFHKKHVCEVIISDGENKISAIWFNQPFMAQYFKADDRVVLHGKAEIYKDRLQMISPEYEIISDGEDEHLSIGRIVPIYPLTRGITQRYLRRAINLCLHQYAGLLHDVLPYDLREKHQLANLVKSLANIHFPESFEAQAQAHRRVSFEEFFLFQISVSLRRLSVSEKKGIAHDIGSELCEAFLRAFPFLLTGAQKRVILEIAQDMRREAPMHRLLQGDVGSGKTLVAFFGCVAAKKNGFQSALMAPTEILAKQHFDVLNELTRFKYFSDLRLALLTGSSTPKEKEDLQQKIKNGEIDLVIGTHALIQDGVDFKNLSFIIIDEQHKFGVKQRSLLSAKGVNPDVLVMTATPIPRTLCLTLYGDLDISVIDEMPPGRGKIKTLLFGEERASEAYEIVRQAAKSKQQVYIVYPLVEESLTLDLKAAKKMFEHFKENEFKDFNLGLIHGQMKPKEATAVMNRFKEKKIDILVATTILEVGVDMPNAAVMVIEHADRFGLSQLHQLRGRIGRREADATCILIADPTTADAKARLDVMLSSTDGFKVAEKDLEIRGPGEFFGRHQHGLNELKVANPITQIDILVLARKEALELTGRDPLLKEKSHVLIKEIIQKRYPNYLEMAKAG